MAKKVIVFMLMFSCLFANSTQESKAPKKSEEVNSKINWCHVLSNTSPSDPNYLDIWERCACQQGGCP